MKCRDSGSVYASYTGLFWAVLHSQLHSEIPRHVCLQESPGDGWAAQEGPPGPAARNANSGYEAHITSRYVDVLYHGVKLIDARDPFFDCGSSGCFRPYTLRARFKTHERNGVR